MTPEQFAKVRAIFDEVVALPTERRTARLRALAGGDTALRQEVESLLAQGSGTSPVDGPVPVPDTILRCAAPAVGPEASTIGVRRGEGRTKSEPAAIARASTGGKAAFPKISGYEVTGRLGEGGMGVVWSAVQLGTRRPVALKLMSAAALGSAKSRARFAREVELAAALQHPNVARVYDSGVHEGIYYYAMELVDGQPLDKFVQERNLTLRQTLGLIRRVCRAVQFAHQRGVIHRDLKPSNVLVSKDGQPHVLDFGLAKATAGDGSAAAVSVAGEVAGTPAFMSPEQAAGRTDALDTRSDVYTLGVIAYKLLTNRFPHDVTGSHLDVIRRVAEADPTLPRSARPDLDVEVESVLLKALARDPDERYQSAAALADDITRYLEGEPVGARQASLTYVLRKRLRKHRGRVLAVAAVVGLLAFTALGAYIQVVEERSTAVAAASRERDARATLEAQTNQIVMARNEAIAAASRERDARSTLQAQADQIVRARNEAVAAAEKAKKAEVAATDAARLAESRRLDAQRALADSQTMLGLTAADRGRPEEAMLWFATAARTGKDFPDLVEPNLVRLRSWSREAVRPLRAFTSAKPNLIAFRFGPTGRYADAAAFDWRQVWDVEGERPFPMPPDYNGFGPVSLSPDGKTIAAVLRGQGAGVGLYALPGLRPLRTFPKEDPVRTLRFSPDGQVLFAGGAATTVAWDVATGGVAEAPGSQDVTIIYVSEDGQKVLTSSEKGGLCVWNLRRGPLQLDLAFPPVAHLGGSSSTRQGDRRSHAQFADGGRALVTRPTSNVLRLIDSTSGATLRELATEDGEAISCFAVNPTRPLVLLGTFRKIEVRDTGSGDVISRIPTSNYSVWAEFNKAGNALLVAGVDGYCRYQHLGPTDDGRYRPAPPILLPLHASVHLASFMPSGRAFATAQDGGLVRVWGLPSDPLLRRAQDGAGTLSALSSDGRWAAQAGAPYRDSKVISVQVHALPDLVPVGPTITPNGADRVRDVTFSPDSTLVLVAAGKTVECWDFKAGKRVGDAVTFASPVAVVRWAPPAAGRSPDRAVALCTDGTAAVFEPRTGRVIGQATRTGQLPSQFFVGNGGVSFRPGSRDVATFGGVKPVVVWDLETGDERLSIPQTDYCFAAEFSASGRYLLTASFDMTCRVYDAETGQELAILRHADWVFGCRMTGDDARVLTACRDKSARLWDWKAGRIIATCQHAEEVFGADLVPQRPGGPPGSQWAVTTCKDGTVRAWDLKSGLPVTPALHVGGGPTGDPKAMALDVHITPDGRTAVVGSSRGLRAMSLTDLNPPAAGSTTVDLDRLITDAELQGGQTVTGSGQVAVPAVEWLARWSKGPRPDLSAYLSDVPVLPTTSPASIAAGPAALPVSERRTTSRPASSSAGPASIPTSSPSVPGSPSGAAVKSLATFDGHTDVPEWVSISPDGSRACSSAADRTTRLWDVRTGRELQRWATREAPIFSDKGQVLLVGRELWDPTVPKRLGTVPKPVRAEGRHALSADGNRVGICGADGSAYVFDRQTSQITGPFAGPGPARACALSPDGGRIFAACDGATGLRGGGVVAWDVRSRTELWRDPDGGRLNPTMLAHGRTLAGDSATRRQDRWGRTWDAETGRVSATVSEAAQFDASGDFAVGWAGNAVFVLDARTGKEVARQPVTAPAMVARATISADAQTVGYGCNDGGVYLWAWRSTRPPLKLDGFAGRVRLISFAPGDRFIAAAGERDDPVIRVWPVAKQP